MEETEFKEFTYKDLENFCSDLLSDYSVKYRTCTGLFRISGFGIVNKKFLNRLNDALLKSISNYATNKKGQTTDS